MKSLKQIPILGFSGYSNSGKTTLIEKIIKNLKQKGIRIAIIKHHGHEGLDVDEVGSDSYRFSEAGADMSIVCSPTKTAIFEQRSLAFQQLVELVHDVDLMIVEGFKREPIPQIGIARKETNKGFPSPFKRYLAIVTNIEDIEVNIPMFQLNQIEEISTFILQTMKLESRESR